MDAVKLFHLVRDDIKIDIEVRFEDEILVIDGYDIGKSVADYWGDSDYEYGAKIFPAGVNRLYTHFNVQEGDEGGLLNAIASQYNSNQCYSQFLQLLDDLHVKYESWSWN